MHGIAELIETPKKRVPKKSETDKSQNTFTAEEPGETAWHKGITWEKV